jgi:mannose-6-phosphate isomerase-like protein (cupin superfamily)
MIDRDHAERYCWGDQCEGWHLVRSIGLSVIQERIPPGAQEMRHKHTHARQFFFVLSGTGTIECNGRRERLGPLQGLEIPPGVSHQLFNEAAEALEFLVVSAPPSHGDRVSE